MLRKFISVVLLISFIGLSLHDFWLAEYHTADITSVYIKNKNIEKSNHITETQKAFFELHKELHKPVIIELYVFIPKIHIDSIYKADYIFYIPKPSSHNIFKPPSLII